MTVSITSASGILALLDEDELELKTYALERLNGLVDEFWAEVADGISKIETLYETPTLPAPTRSLAALVASKIYYHLGDLDESLAFALGAGDRFDVEKVGTGGAVGEYVETVVSQCIDSYVALRTAHEEPSPLDVKVNGDADPSAPVSLPNAAAKSGKIDPRMESIVERMFARCVGAGEYRQALGIALESRRLDVVESIASKHHRPRALAATTGAKAGKAGIKEDEGTDLLGYILEASMTVVTKVAFRNEVLRLLVRLFGAQSGGPDYFSITQTFVYLNDPQLATRLLQDLLSSSKADAATDDRVLIAYQICFDLAETATQEFLESVRNGLGPSEPKPEDASMQTDAPRTMTPLERARAILTGEESIKLYLEFLYRSNKSDLLILNRTKDLLDARSSLYHSAVGFANSFAHAGTTSDQFLRDNLDWLSKATNWTKFSVTAGLGVIHRGNLAQGIQVLEPYLPPLDGTPSNGGQGGGSFYSEGGSLFALGLIHANHGGSVLESIRKAMKANQSEILQHGAALGLGVAGMATGNEDLYDDLREVLYNDSAIAGEAAGYAMGLVMLGTGSAKAVEEMLQYAHETQHEKIIRGLAVGISLLFYGKEEAADSIIETLVADKDPILRYGGIYAVALAYAGTGNNKAIRRLLHVAVSDVNDDVRRAAVTALGFLLFRTPSQVPRIVQLLSESYNPHVRYGAAIALGIACAGTGLAEAIELLEPMTKDTVDYVKQGSCIALAMILIQQNETLNPKTADVRKLFEKIVADRHEDAMAKFGAAVAQGIIDAGGRNATVSMRSKNGSGNMAAIVGMALFNQFWYWFPMAQLISLAFTPTAVIGVDSEMRMPRFEFESNTRPSLFAYQPATAPPTEEKVEKVATAVLSTTAKAKQRERTKKDKAAAESGEMDTDEKPAVAAAAQEDEAMKIDEPTAAATADGAKATVNGEASATPAAPTAAAQAPEKPAKKGKKEKDEPASERLPNLSRVTPTQLPYISFPSDARFVPVRPFAPPASAVKPEPRMSTAHLAHSILQRAEFAASITGGGAAGGGIVVVKDREAGKEVEYLELTSVKDLSSGEPIAASAANGDAAAGGAGAQGDRALADEPIAEVPPSFEYDFSS